MIHADPADHIRVDGAPSLPIHIREPAPVCGGGIFDGLFAGNRRYAGGAPMQGCEHPEAHRQSEHAYPREREGYPSADGPPHAAPPSKGFSSPQEAHTEPVCTVSSQASFTSTCS